MGFLYADVSCQRDVGKLGAKVHAICRKITVAVTWDTAERSPRVYGEQDVDILVRTLEQASVIVSYNCHNFDFKLIRGYRPFQPKRVLDMFFDLWKRTGQQVSMEAIGEPSFGGEPDLGGVDHIALWEAGQFPLLEYSCIRKLRRMRRVHEFGVEHGQITFEGRFPETP